MNTSLKFLHWFRHPNTPKAVRPRTCRRLNLMWFVDLARLVLASAWVLVALTGLAQQSRVQLVGDQLGPGAIAIAGDDIPAAFSFEPPQGRIESAGEGAASATRALLNTPDLGHAWITAGAGVVEFVFAPIAAGYGALSSARERLPPDKLAETEAALAEAMKALAGQEHLRELLIQATNEIGRPLLALGRGPMGPAELGAVSARLEARVEKLRLERVDRHDRFALRITARVRLLRMPNSALLYERPYEYRSGKAMFIDWARLGGFEGTARTGYRDLAERIANDVAKYSREAPMLLGAGYSAGAERKPASHMPLTSGPSEQEMVALVSFKQNRFGDVAAISPARLARRSTAQPQLVPVADHQADALSFEIQSTEKTSFLLQVPLTKAQATADAQSDTEWTLDGLENDRNFVVQAGAAVAAIPLGIWEQSMALWHGVSSRRLAKARASLEAATNYARPQEALALEVARNFTPPNDQILPAMAFAPRPGRHSPPLSYSLFDSVPGNVTKVERGDTVLEIRVLRAGLSGAEGINPRLALNVEARASVIRIADGVEVYSLPVSYRSREKRFCAWAAHDARAFRQELNSCYRQMGQTMAAELASRGFAPSRRTSVLASN